MSDASGFFEGRVVDLDDPSKEGRARLLVPAVLGESRSAWAKPALGSESASTAQVGDRAWVGFERNNTDTPIWFPPVNPSKPQTTTEYRLVEEFDGAVGSGLATASTGQQWETASGTWVHSADGVQNDGVISTALIDPGGNSGDVDLTAVMRITTATSGTPGIIFRAADDSNRLMIGYARPFAALAIYRVQDGTTTVEVQKVFSWPLNVDVTVRVLAVGDNIKVWINGTQQFNHTLSAPVHNIFKNYRRVGIRDNATTLRTVFKDLRVLGDPREYKPSRAYTPVVTAAGGARGRLLSYLSHAVGPVHVMFIGSSTTFGSIAKISENRYVNRVIRGLQAAAPSPVPAFDPPTQVLTGAAVTRSVLRAVHGWNAGVGGYASDTYAPTFVLNQTTALQPRVVFHMIGSNDYATDVPPETYAENISAAIKAIDTRCTIPPVHILVHSYRRIDTTGALYSWDAYGEAMRGVAERNPNTRIFIDTSNALANAGANFVTDLVHQNDLGHGVTAKAILDALDLPVSEDNRWQSLDTFRRTGTLHASTNATGQVWNVVSGAFAVDSNTRQVSVTTGGTALVGSNLLPGEKIDLNVVMQNYNSAALVGAIFRAQDDANRLGVFFNGVAVSLYRSQTGVGTVVDKTVTKAISLNVPHHFQIVMEGDTVNVFVDGDWVMDYTYPTVINDVFKAYTAVGIRSATVHADIRWSNFGVREPRY